jgi:8-oxo-dGTP pyrophosphatase MutT (NUDIX family)
MNKTNEEQYALDNPVRNVAVVGLRDVSGQVLLMRSHKLPSHWQPFGGGIDQEDASPKDAAIRELNEELGIRLSVDSLIEVLQTPYDFGEGTIYFFEAVVDKDQLKLVSDQEEVLELKWFSPQDVSLLNAMPATKKYLQTLQK